MDGDAGVLVGVVATLGGDHVALARVGAASMDVTVLEDNRSIAKDEINSASDIAGAVELAEGVDVEGVLVGKHVALVKGA